MFLPFHNMLYLSQWFWDDSVRLFRFLSRVTLWNLNIRMHTEDRCYLLNMLIFQNFLLLLNSISPCAYPCWFSNVSGSHLFLGSVGESGLRFEKNIWVNFALMIFSCLSIFLPSALVPSLLTTAANSCCHLGLGYFL